MKAIISLSGGMDSATVLAMALSHRRECQCVGFYYGSTHNQYENEAASQIAQHYEVRFDLIDLSPIMGFFNSALIKANNREIPEGHYEEESMKDTVVPGRNMIFSSILVGHAWSAGAKEVWLGIHAGDHAIYADCRPKFFRHMNEAVIEGTDGRITLRAPFLHQDKKHILTVGHSLSLGVPYHLTRTCYKDQEIACGKCGACVERRSAFLYIGVEDPIEYEYKGPLPRKPL